MNYFYGLHTLLDDFATLSLFINRKLAVTSLDQEIHGSSPKTSKWERYVEGKKKKKGIDSTITNHILPALR